MSRNVVAILVVLSIFTGLKGAQWLYNEVVDSNTDVDSQNWEDRELSNRKAIQNLRIGDSIDNVSANMGTADFNEIKPIGDKRYQVLYFRTHRAAGDGITTKDECTPLVFEHSTLIGWGHEFYDFTFGEQTSDETQAEDI